jgi:hypothetical protein
MRRPLDAAGTTDIRDETDDTCPLNGTARMGDDPQQSVVNADYALGRFRPLWVLRWLGVPDRRRRQSLADHGLLPAVPPLE